MEKLEQKLTNYVNLRIEELNIELSKKIQQIQDNLNELKAFLLQ